ncbi:MAG: hypothetical protein H7287_09155 [Thermoleophilia bacterium]|nr:hypothetical protein [Thermoleophilia bacterium]
MTILPRHAGDSRRLRDEQLMPAAEHIVEWRRVGVVGTLTCSCGDDWSQELPAEGLAASMVLATALAEHAGMQHILSDGCSARARFGPVNTYFVDTAQLARVAQAWRDTRAAGDDADALADWVPRVSVD